MSSICGTASSSSSLLSTELSSQSIVYVNVGGQVFTTTKRTLCKSGLFQKLFSTSTSNTTSNSSSEKTEELITTNTTNSASAPASSAVGVYLCHSNYYFVDRSPLLFEDILHFLRNLPANSAETFLHRYYGASSLSLSRRSSYSLTSNASDCAGMNLGLGMNMGMGPMNLRRTSMARDLLKLQDEAVFYHIPSLVDAIQDRLDDESKELHMASCKEIASPRAGDTLSTTLQSRAPQYSQSQSISVSNLVSASRPSPLVLNPMASAMAPLSEREPDLSWWDQSGPLNGLRRIEGTRIAFATSMDNWVDKHCRFEAPRGFKWATQSMYLAEYHAHREILGRYKQWIHFGVGAWDNYRWKYARKVAFIFADTFRSQRFVHSGMEVCDINHVKSIFGLVAESPLMDYDDDKGIVEGFAGLVLLADEEWHPEEAAQSAPAVKDIRLTLPVDIKSSVQSASGDEIEHKDNTKVDEDEVEDEEEKGAEVDAVVVIDDDAATASTWSSVSETEEQLKGVILELSAGERHHNLDFSHTHDHEEEKDKADTKDDKDKDTKSNSPSKSNNSNSNSNSKEKEPKVSGQGQGEQVLAAVNSKKVLSPAAVPYPSAGSTPLLANPFAEYTKQQRAKLTKNNLEKHTRIESIKHRTQQQVQQVQQQQPHTHYVPRHGQTLMRHGQQVSGQVTPHSMNTKMTVPVRSPKMTMSSAAAVHAMSPKSSSRFTPKYPTAVGSPTFYQPTPYHAHAHGHPHGHPQGQMHVLPRHQFPPAHGHSVGHAHGAPGLMYQTPPMMPVTNAHSFAPPPLGTHLSVNSMPSHQ